MFEFLLRWHIPDWALRRYRDGSLEHCDSERLENHLLLCPICQLQLEDLPSPKLRPALFTAAETAA